jgi:hypothetical protein
VLATSEQLSVGDGTPRVRPSSCLVRISVHCSVTGKQDIISWHQGFERGLWHLEFPVPRLSCASA